VVDVWKQEADQYVVASEESGTARCPFERTHNSTTHYAGITTVLLYVLFQFCSICTGGHGEKYGHVAT